MAEWTVGQRVAVLSSTHTLVDVRTIARVTTTRVTDDTDRAWAASTGRAYGGGRWCQRIRPATPADDEAIERQTLVRRVLYVSDPRGLTTAALREIVRLLDGGEVRGG